MISDEIWGRHNRIWCTSRFQVLAEYAKTQVGLLWAPELRYGSLGQTTWKGTVTIKDLTGRKILTRGTCHFHFHQIFTFSGSKTPVSYVTVSVDEKEFSTKNIKDPNPRWTALDFVGYVNLFF